MIVVENIEESQAFYRDVFDLFVVSEFEGNRILSEGLVLQDEKLWKEAIGQKVEKGGYQSLLYFEVIHIENLLLKLQERGVTILQDFVQGKKRVLRFLDPDLHLIEVRSELI